MLSPGLVVAERYELDRELGHGGMGSVWLAHHTQLDTPCAIKFIHAEAATQSEVRARFEREAKAAAQIRSSHVVQILDYGVWRDIPYIAMEYLQGEDLAVRLKRRVRLSAAETSSIITQVARALTKAHAAGLVHRDLKPENIFLVTEDDQEVAKVLDFGIAKSHEKLLSAGNNTKTGSLLGTPHYMSPEQAQGTKTVDHRSDLWSLAVVAYRCLTGRLPFESDALGDLLLKIIVQPLPRPSSIEASVPPGFDAWWARATDRDPAGRFQSAKEMSDALPMALGISHLGLPSSSQLSQSVAPFDAAARARAQATAPMATPPGPDAFGRAPMPTPPPGHDPLAALSFGPMTDAPAASPHGVPYAVPQGAFSVGAQTPGLYPTGQPGVPNALSTDSIQVSKTVNELTIPKRNGGVAVALLIGALALGALAAVGFVLLRGTGPNPPADTREAASPATVASDDGAAAGISPSIEPTGAPEDPPAPSSAPSASAATQPGVSPTTAPPSKLPPSKPPPSLPPEVKKTPPPPPPPPSKPPPATPPPKPGNNWGF